LDLKTGNSLGAYELLNNYRSFCTGTATEESSAAWIPIPSVSW
jgi:hypothetical protein